MIRVENVSFRYPGSDNYIINDLSCSFRRGEVTAVTGRNGCGKTTLARLLTGVSRPEKGRIVICGADGETEDIADMSLSAIGRRAGSVYQDPTRQLFCETVYEEIAYGIKNKKNEQDKSGHRDLADEEIDRRVVQAMEYFMLSDKADEYPGTMSQGEKQRVMLAAVTALDTQYVILDEPTSGLDMEGCERLGELIREMSARGAGVVIVSHERPFIDKYADIEIKFDEINNIKDRDIAEEVQRGCRQPDKKHIVNGLGKLDMRSRMFASICIVMTAVLSRDPVCLVCVLAFAAALTGIAGGGISDAFYRVRGMAGLALSLFILQCIFVRSGDALFSINNIAVITYDGSSMAAVSALRLMIFAFTALIMASGDIRSCIAALSQMHIPYDIVFMVMAALKFLPFLREESTDVMNASKMRGAAFDDMSMIERMRFYLRLTVPVTAGAIRRADKMNVAMAARGFRAFGDRTRFFSVRMHAYDWLFIGMVSIITLIFKFLFN